MRWMTLTPKQESMISSEISAKDKVARTPETKKNKFGNKSVTYFGITFQSKAEGLHFLVLKSRQERREIKDLTLQPSFLVHEAFTDSMGNEHEAIHYVADFMYIENGETVVVDVKGFLTDVYKLKKKLFLNRYFGIKFIEVYY